jgi:hypothetical protein
MRDGVSHCTSPSAAKRTSMLFWKIETSRMTRNMYGSA